MIVQIFLLEEYCLGFACQIASLLAAMSGRFNVEEMDVR